MPPVFWRQLLRCVRQSAGRFVAIVLIVALGCGFFAGLRMTGVGMRQSADAFFDRTKLYDLELVSTLGFSSSQVDEVASTEGVAACEPGRSVDVMAQMGDAAYACRVTALDSWGESGFSGGPMNGLELVSGRWPETPGECVIVSKKADQGAVPHKVDVLYGASDLDGVLAERDFSVVGTVLSSAHVHEAVLGPTSLGSGTLGQALFVLPAAFEPDAPYTEIYVRAAGAAEALWGSDSYNSAVDAVAERLDAQVAGIAEKRTHEVRSDAQMDEGKKKLEERAAEVERQLAEGKAELDEAKAQLDSGADEVESGRAELSAGRARLEKGQAQYASGKAELEGRTAELDEGRRRLGAAAAQVDAQKKELADAQSALAAQAPAIEQARSVVAAFDGGQTALVSQAKEAGIDGDDAEAVAGAAQAALDELRKAQEAGVPGLDGQVAALEALASAAASLAAQAPRAEASGRTVAAYEAGQAQLDEGFRRIAEAEAELEDNRATLDAGAAQLAEGAARLSDSAAQLDEAKDAVAAGERALADAEERLAGGRASYEKGLAEYEEGRRKALDGLAEAQESLDSAQRDVDAIEPAEVYVLDRGQNYGAACFLSDSERMDAIATAFPFFFFLVAALVSLTTMTRMVDDDRGLMGTLKALGYSRAAICARYVIYAGAASVTGALLGIVSMSQLLPWVIFTAYGIIYGVPARPMPLPMEPGPAVAAAVIGVAVTVGAAVAACLSSLRESPAALMQPKAPKAGRRILLERVGPVWRRLSFSWKVTLRNIFLYRRRFVMTVVGVAGCCALLLTGFGVRDAVNDIIDKQFGQIVHYNAIVGFSDDATAQQKDEVLDALGSMGPQEPVGAFERNVVARPADSAKDCSVVLVVPQGADDLRRVVTLRTRQGQDPIDFGPDSVVLTEKLATTLGVAAGDTVRLWGQDATGNASGAERRLTVTDVCENYLGSYIYLGSDAYEEAFGEPGDENTAFAFLPADAAERSADAERLQAMGGVETLMLNDETIETYRNMLSSVDLVMVVLIAAAALLAFVVLYNLANINIAERSREIASLKVLGFLPKEVCSYVYREILIIVVIGALVGLVLGTWFEGYVVVTAEVDAAMFGREIHAMSYVWAFGLTLAFAIVVLAAMVPKLASIDMVESLKSAE
ncbi:FtsX-like permease family protein [Atopobiaceae bacterium 24-176]